jgi:hypothetical protein
VSERKAREALDFVVNRYVALVGRNGPAFVLAEQAMAMEAAMAELSILSAASAHPVVRVQAIRAREELRRTWLDLLSKVGALKFTGKSLFGDSQSDLTDEERRRLVRIGTRRLKQARLIKEVVDVHEANLKSEVEKQFKEEGER